MDQFDVLQTLGRGSFGVVRKVRRRADGKTLVVKEMDYGSADEKQKEQIVAEVNILREMRHPFIVRYYDRIVDRRKTRLHIVMEHCSTDLARVIRARRLRGEYLEESFLWNILCQVVVALEFCHGRIGRGGARRPIIHRDLKPENVFLTEDNVVKLGDFGLARELNGAQLAETSVGTPYYMSPELINEQRYDERTDVWSLGCLMYEAAALSRPFNAHNQLALAMKINTEKVAPIPSRYSPSLFATIEWMLNKVRHKRPRMEDLVKVPGLQVPLRENRLLVREFQLQQSYTHRLRDLKARELEVARREAELAAAEASLRRRTQAFALLEQEHAAASSTPSPLADCAVYCDRERDHQHQQQQQQPRISKRETGFGFGREQGVGGERLKPRREEEILQEDGVVEKSEDVGSERVGVVGRPESGGVSAGLGDYDSPRSTKSELRQNITEATTAVLDYASLVLHSSPCDSSSSGDRQGPTRAPEASHLDDTIPLGLTDATPAPDVVPRKYRHHEVSVDRGFVLSGDDRVRGWGEEEPHSRKAEAVAAAGRRARESYAGFIETMSAARDLDTWAPARGKENLHSRAPIVRPRLAPSAPLTDVFEGGRRYRHVACHLDPKEARGVPRRVYQRSARDLASHGYTAPAVVAVGGGGGRGGRKEAGDEFTAVVVARARTERRVPRY